MIDKISHAAAGFLASIDGDKDDKAPIYQVGIDVVLSTWITAVGILALGTLLNNILGCLVFLLCFMTIRSYSGGYHAKTRTRCFVLTCGAYMFTTVSGIMKLAVYYWHISAATAVIVLIVWFLFVPIENKNKRLPADWKVRNRKKAWISVSIWYVAAAGLQRFNEPLSFQIVLTILVIAILILWCRPWRETI